MQRFVRMVEYAWVFSIVPKKKNVVLISSVISNKSWPLLGGYYSENCFLYSEKHIKNSGIFTKGMSILFLKSC